MTNVRLALLFTFLSTGLVVAVGCGDDDAAAPSLPDGGGGGPDTSVATDTGAGDPNAFTIPSTGGTASVALPGGAKVDFVFPASAGGKTVVLTPSDATSIGWPADQFAGVIKMEPDGTTFADPVVVKPSTLDSLVFSFPTNAAQSKGEGLATNAAGDGVLLSHFSTLAIIPPKKSCGDRDGWVKADNAQECAAFAPATTRVTMDCTTDPYCARVTAHCCVTPGAESGCSLGSRDLVVSYAPAQNPPAYCGATDAGSDATDASDANDAADAPDVVGICQAPQCTANPVDGGYGTCSCTRTNVTNSYSMTCNGSTCLCQKNGADAIAAGTNPFNQTTIGPEPCTDTANAAYVMNKYCGGCF